MRLLEDDYSKLWVGSNVRPNYWDAGLLELHIDKIDNHQTELLLCRSMKLWFRVTEKVFFTSPTIQRYLQILIFRSED